MDATRSGRWTRAGMLRLTAGAGATATGAAVLARGGDGDSHAAPSAAQDRRLLGFFAGLERLQERFYGAAVERGSLPRDLLRFATLAAAQEEEHARLLEQRLGGRADELEAADFGSRVADRQGFARAAIALEEAALGAYIAHGADLTRPALEAVVPIVSVEARQAAWVRDLAGADPAPHVADPARKPRAILADLRAAGLIR